MRLRDDERAQSVQIGAVLLFAVLVIAFSSYQAFVVPNQNRAVEFNHNEQIRNQMQDLRNELVSIHGETATQSVSLTLGTQYPGRLVAVNPGPPSGTIRTAGTGPRRVNLTLANAEAVGETGDFWNGIDNRTYNTGSLVYQPNYNVYGGAPLTIYENSVLYNQFRAANLTASGQTLIDDERISLVTVNGSVSQTRTGSASLDLQPVSTSSTTVSVSNASATENVTLVVATQLPRQRWGTLLEDQLYPRGHVVDYGVDSISGSPFDRLWIELEPGVNYQLRMTKVGVGTGVTDESRAYLTDVAGNGTRLDVDDTATVSLEVRDAYNNPISGAQVNASPSNGVLSPENKSTDGDGEVTFTYDSTGVSGDQWVDLNFSVVTDPGADFDASTPENVTMQVRVQSSQSTGSDSTTDSGPFNVSWLSPAPIPSNAGADLSMCSDEFCQWDVGGSDSGTLRFNATTSPTFEGVAMDFAVNNSTVVTVSPGSESTGSYGKASTELTAKENGSVAVTATGGTSGDLVDVQIVNVTGSSATTLRVRVEDVSNVDQDRGWYVISYEIVGGTDSVDTVSVLAQNNDDGVKNWNNSTSIADTRAILDNNGGGDPFDIVVTARNANGDSLASATFQDDSADARNTSGNQVLGNGDPSFDTFEITDQSNNGPAYDITYTVDSGSFGQVRGFLLSQETTRGGGWDDTTLNDPTDSAQLSTYGQTSGQPDQFKTVLLLYNDEGIITDTAVFVDEADGSGQKIG